MLRSRPSAGCAAATSLLLLLLLLTGAELRSSGDSAAGMQLEAVKSGILHRLGLRSPPVIQQRPSQEEIRQMYRLYEKTLTELRGNVSHGESRRRRHLLIPQMKLGKKAVRIGGSPEMHHQRLKLVFSRTKTLHQKLHVLQAELRLFKKVLGVLSQSDTRLNSVVHPVVNIYKTEDFSHVNGHLEHQLLDSKPFSEETLTFNLQFAIQKWVASSEKTLHLELDFVLEIPPNLPEKWEGINPVILEVETQRGGGSRARKARAVLPNEEDCKNSETNCCRKSLRVSFEEIGWSDWVMAPKSYTMYFCDGSCPHNYKPASMHAQIKARMHNLSNGATPAPCCVPANYGSMVLMHYNSVGKLILTPFEDMIVQKCHCA
uniref:Growth/differentiation factor 15 n=1 Tax=Geotrypetes seraphini TaxID=260995 RepID=A0A6P8S993_GEOSA|nr:growth/differentiation factor 15 [Geotrypetes seraphini]